MPKHTPHAKKLAKEIHKALQGNNLLKEGDAQDGAVIDTLLHSMANASFPEKEAISKNVTLLLSDIRGFSEITASCPAKDVVRLLNLYFDCMGAVITRYGGHIDKLMGDSILVLFGIPEAKSDDIERAIACAIEMQLAMTDLNEENKSLGLPELFMGIALNSGTVVAGEVGSKHYNEYTVIGNEVNLVSRIESHCLRGQILISENTYKEVRDHLKVGEPNTVEVKGIRKAVDIYELHSTSKPKAMTVPRRDKRQSARIQVCMPVTFQNLSGKTVLSQKHRGDALDISYHGLLLKTEIELSKHAEIKMTLATELFSDRVTDVYARVVRTTKLGKQFHNSLEFTAISADGENIIKQYIDQLIASS